MLAWVISLPLAGAAAGDSPLGWLDAAGVAAWLVGLVFEAGGDWQLARFKRDPANAGQVMDRGLWRYTRHPNYFGDFCVWWGFYLIALAAGAWWTILGPLIMSFLLLRFSGVRLLERDIGERRPAYAEYMRRTNVFSRDRARHRSCPLRPSAPTATDWAISGPVPRGRSSAHRYSWCRVSRDESGWGAAHDRLESAGGLPDCY